jgi:hypothetical protein
MEEEKAVEEEKSLDESLAETFDEINKRDEEPEAVKEEVSEEVEEEDELVVESEEEPKEEAKEEAKEETKEEPQPEEETQEEEADSEDVTEERETQSKRPPSTWSAKGKASFSKLPKHIQDEIIKREADIGKGISMYKQAANYGRSIGEAIKPYEAMIRSENSDPIKTVQSLLNTAYRLRSGTPQQRGQLVMQIAQQYGADLSQYSSANAENTENQEIPELQQYLNPLQEKINNLEQVYASQQQAVQQQTQQEAVTSIGSFQNQVDEKGNIRNVHFDDVRNDMADLIESAERQGRQLSLEEAYETACWANPQIRSVKLTQANKKRKEEAQKKSKQANKIAQTNLSTKPLAREGIATDASGDIKDTLEETLASINNRH